jgi:hypothetical protein
VEAAQPSTSHVLPCEDSSRELQFKHEALRPQSHVARGDHPCPKYDTISPSALRVVAARRVA